MYDNVRRELKLLAILFGLAILVGLEIYLIGLWENRLIISPLDQSTFRIPSRSTIQEIAVDNGRCASPEPPCYESKAFFEWLMETYG